MVALSHWVMAKIHTSAVATAGHKLFEKVLKLTEAEKAAWKVSGHKMLALTIAY